MKKFAAIALAAVLSFGCAVPAFAAGPHHGAGRCLDYAGFCQGVAQNVLAPGLQSLNDRLNAVLAWANGAQAVGAGTASGASAQAQGRVDAQTTSPSLCARGACGLYLDADGDGVCDYHGQGCMNMGGDYIDTDGDGVCDNYGTRRSGASGANIGGTGYGAGTAASAATGNGAHRSSGHHGGWHH